MKLTWQTFAGGTCAAEGKYSYAAYGTFGQYHVEPVSWPNGRHKYYVVKFANMSGKSIGHGGLWHELGTVRHPQIGKKICREHAEKHFS